MTRYRQEDEAPSGITSPPLLLTNANVVTLDDDVPRGEALLLAGGRVVRVGSTARPDAPMPSAISKSSMSVVPRSCRVSLTDTPTSK